MGFVLSNRIKINQLNLKQVFCSFFFVMINGKVSIVAITAGFRAAIVKITVESQYAAIEF